MTDCARPMLMAAGFVLIATGASAQGAARSTFNVYASVQMADPQYIQKGEAVRIKLMRCGMEVISDETRNFTGLAPDLFVVLSGPHRSADAAQAALAKAKSCGVTGYSRQARRRYGD